MKFKAVFSSFSLGGLRQWHWISSAVCLLGMLLFAVTGITLNHAEDIKVTPVVHSVELELSEAQLQLLTAVDHGPLPFSFRQWLWQQHQIATSDRAAEWDTSEVYLGMPSPGGDAWLSIDLESGELLYENTDRGLISYLNDLHKGRHTGAAWRWFIDVFSVLCIVFSLTGFWLLLRSAKQRRSTWPWVGLGILIPLILIILTVH